MKKFILFASLIILTATTYAQNCTQTLRLARSTYDQGRLHELPSLLKACLANGFTKQERIEAYKLLTLTFIYLEEPEKADSSMLKLLHTDSYFEPNNDIDPQEFIGLYNTFRTNPIFTIGVKLGANSSFTNIISNYYVGANAKGGSEYSNKIGLQLGLSFEKGIFQNSKNKILNRLILAPEILSVPRTFGIRVPTVFQTDLGAVSEAKSEAVESQAWIDLNALVQYQIKPKSKFNPFLTVGPGISYLVSATRQQVFNHQSGAGVSGPDVPIINSMKSAVFSVVVGTGIKIKVGSVYLTTDLRYQYGLSNITNSSARTNLENTFDYVSQFNDYSINNFAIMIGGAYSVFKPKKKTHQK